MFLVGMISWWYGHGLGGQFGRIRDRLVATARFFSIGQLLKTWFSPFRQISAGRVHGPVAVQLRAFFDQTISRVIGAFVRTVTIVAGVIVMVVQVVAEAVILCVWVTLPAFPVVGFILFALGWVPQWT